MKYRKKPAVIEAFRLVDGASLPLWLREAEDAGSVERFSVVEPATCAGQGLRIKTLEGDMLASPGDWIIRGVRGELYPCKPDIFEATYEAME